MENTNNFSVRLKELRTDKKLSILQLAKETKISKSSISRWENGQADIKAYQLIVLANYFGVTIDYLLGCDK